MKTIVILNDSVNRRYLKTYNSNAQTITPNIERLQSRSCIFDNHWTGSAPCMPARRDMFTGRLNFLERNWGPVEPFDCMLPELLRKHKVRSHMVTDHFHYLELGGGGYCQSFDTWECFRGQEHDSLEWTDPGFSTPPYKGRFNEYYYENSKGFKEDSDFTTPRTFQSAARWLERHGDEDDYMLWIEGFDPHEPFDTPKEFLDLYDDTYEGDQFIWPEYAPFTGTEEELKHIRNRYAATISMTDKWIGKILDICDRQSRWDDTLIIFTTDHGYMLGEHGLMAKNYMPAYNEVFHIPLFVHVPGQNSEKRISALTQNIDLFPTIASYHGIQEDELPDTTQGKNLLPLISGSKDSLRDYVLYGLFGQSLNITDGRYSYFKCPAREDNQPLNIYTSMPVTLNQYMGGENIRKADKIDMGRFLSWTDYPVYSIPANDFLWKNESQRFDKRTIYHSANHLFDLENDYEQNRELDNPEIEARMEELMKRALMEYGSPGDQFERLGF